MFSGFYRPFGRYCQQITKFNNSIHNVSLRCEIAQGCQKAGVYTQCQSQKVHQQQDLKTKQAIHQSRQRFSASLAVSKMEDYHPCNEVMERISEQQQSGEVGRLFAVVHVSGKQRKITVEDIVVLDKFINADIGQQIRLNKVLLVGSKDFTLIGRPVLHADMACVKATVIEKTLSHTMTLFIFHRRQHHRRLKLKKIPQTFLRINEITLSSLEK